MKLENVADHEETSELTETDQKSEMTESVAEDIVTDWSVE